MIQDPGFRERAHRVYGPENFGVRVQGLTGYRSQSFGVRGQQMSPSLAPKQPLIEKYQNHVYTTRQVICQVESLI